MVAPFSPTGRVEVVAQQLLGCVLSSGAVAGRIVEVEAYGAEDDAASHAFRGPTARNASMFGSPGTLYVYLIYGMHWCANVACGPPGEASAVLIRALEPVQGLDLMWSRRPKARAEVDLCSGPGKLCASLDITGDHDGVSLLRSPPGSFGPTLRRGSLHGGEEIVCGPRIGITKEVDRPWRFAISGNRYMSRPLM